MTATRNLNTEILDYQGKGYDTQTKSKSYNQIMGYLPPSRVTPARLFIVSGPLQNTKGENVQGLHRSV